MITDPTESSFGLQPNVAAGLAALFGWVGGLIILLGKPPQAWVRFVAIESIVLSVAYMVIAFALSILGGMVGLIPGVRLVIWPIIGLAYMVLGLAAFVGWLILTINAFSGKSYRLPVVGDFADRFTAASTSL